MPPAQDVINCGCSKKKKKSQKQRQLSKLVFWWVSTAGLMTGRKCKATSNVSYRHGVVILMFGQLVTVLRGNRSSCSLYDI